jgi:hypothetical protein
MKNRGATGRYFQTAFLQAEGELYLSPLSQPKTAAAIPARSESQSPSKILSPSPASQPSGSPRIWQPENYSIPIDRVPAQFNAFYPQCSGQKLGSFHHN